MGVVRSATGRRIFYDDLGAGPALLLLPGGVGSRRGVYTALIEALTSHLRVITMDHRDSGESEPEADYYTVADLADDAAALLDALGIPRAHVMGHSFSGLVALQLALDRADRVDRLVLVSTFAQGDPSHRAGDPMPPPADWWDDDPVVWVRRALPGVLGPDYRNRVTDAEITALAELERGNRATWSSWLHRTAAGAAVDFSDSLPQVAAPTLVIHGDADPLVPTDRATALADRIPDARLVLLAGVGHLPWLEQLEVATGAIFDFLGDNGDVAQQGGVLDG